MMAYAFSGNLQPLYFKQAITARTCLLACTNYQPLQTATNAAAVNLSARELAAQAATTPPYPPHSAVVRLPPLFTVIDQWRGCGVTQ